MIQVDFAWYSGTYQGFMGEADFARLSRRASAYVEHVTFGRAARADGTMLEQVRDAVCAVADELLKQENGGTVASASNDGYTETYESTGRNPAQRLYDAAAVYLTMTGLLYQGV